MKWQNAVLLTVLAVAAGWAPRSVQAASLRIPAVVYPRGAHIAYHPALTNAEMDCLWGFFCEGNVPLFHFQTQDQLHRVGGWAQFAGSRRHGKIMAFQLFASYYGTVSSAEDVPWSARALADLRAALRARGYVSFRHLSPLVPATDSGGSLAVLEPSDDYDLVVMACWRGSLEVEALAMYDHQSHWARYTALSDLRLQVRAAIQSRETATAEHDIGKQHVRWPSSLKAVR